MVKSGGHPQRQASASRVRRDNVAVPRAAKYFLSPPENTGPKDGHVLPWMHKTSLSWVPPAGASVKSRTKSAHTHTTWDQTDDNLRSHPLRS